MHSPKTDFLLVNFFDALKNAQILLSFPHHLFHHHYIDEIDLYITFYAQIHLYFILALCLKFESYTFLGRADTVIISIPVNFLKVLISIVAYQVPLIYITEKQKDFYYRNMCYVKLNRC